MEAIIDQQWNSFTYTGMGAASRFINKQIMPKISNHTIVMGPTETGYQLQVTGPEVNRTWTK